MDKLKLNLENCYGIQKMDAMLDYSKNNVAIIYAPNGSMKSSLAKTFESIRDNLYEQVKTKLKYSPRSSFETKNSMLKIGAIL